jgi:hypothetical protein
MQNVLGLDRNGSPFERFKQVASIVVRIPKVEADKNIEKPAGKAGARPRTK